MRSILTACTTVATLLFFTPAAEAAAPPMEIRKVYYDSPGTDRRSNSSLNAEYVTIRNNTGKAVRLKGWTLRDKSGWIYRFTSDRTLKSKATLTIRTGQGRDRTSSVYWGRRAYVWNNDRDTAYLRSSTGRLIDSCSYNSTRYDYRNC